MTDAELLVTAPRPPMTFVRRAILAGNLAAACDELGSGFKGEVGGWRVLVGKIVEQRQMMPSDLGLEEPK